MDNIADTNDNYIEVEEVEESFAMVPKAALIDPRLSLKAKGLYAFLYSLPKKWKVYRTELLKHLADGKDSLNSAFKELEKFGYLQSTPVRLNGKFKGYKLKLVIKPGDCEITPLRNNRNGKTVTGKTVSGKSAPININSSNTDSKDNSLFNNKEEIDLFLLDFNNIRGTKYTLITKVRTNLRERFKAGYTYKDILQAYKNAITDQFHIDNNFNNLTLEFITRPDKFELYLNYITKKKVNQPNKPVERITF